MAFVRNRKHLSDFVNSLQKVTCVYAGPRCDCKYGRDPSSCEHQGERTGCPELRMVQMLVDQLSDEEFSRLMTQAGGVLI